MQLEPPLNFNSGRDNPMNHLLRSNEYFPTMH